MVSIIWWSAFPLESMFEVARCLEKKHGEVYSHEAAVIQETKKGCLKI